MRYLTALVLLLCSVSVPARMYQWTDPDTGITQLAGKPPPWYRSEQNGPRVFVFDNGRVIDDTAITVTDSERVQLRRQAFMKPSGDKGAAVSGLRSVPGRQPAPPAEGSRPTAPKEAASPQSQAPPPESPPPAERAQASPSATEEKMRELIERWEALQTENARRTVNGQKPVPGQGH